MTIFMSPSHGHTLTLKGLIAPF